MAERMHRLVAVVTAACLISAAAACTDDDADAVAEPEGEVIGSGDDYQAVIRRTAEGVPHISGETVADVTFGQGWASGEDRSCDLVDQILKVRGERSRWFGPGEDDANVDSDLAWRSIGIFDRASDEWDSDDGPTQEIRDLLGAFAAGWNAQLDEVGVDGLTGWCAGAEWVRPVEAVELYAYARSIALLASGGNELLVQAVAEAEPPSGGPPATEAAGASADSTAPAADGASDGGESAVRAAASAGADELAAGAAPWAAGDLGSNGWAIGADRSASDGGMLVANPHFPWEGELRFWEVHLTVPGEVDAYGVQLSGLPGIGIGFTEHFGWTHTVSAGARFTAYRLDLVPGNPTAYAYGDEQRDMTGTDVTVEVLDDDGTVTDQTRTMWSSHYGPIISVPSFGVGWSEEIALTYRDANIDNDEFLDQYFAMLQADDFDQFVEAHDRYAAIPLFNTIAASDDGRAWYADYSATPNLSDEGLAAYEQAKESDPLIGAAADNGLVLLDGSDPVYEWQEEDGARDPGLVPTDELPQVERDDYVFNANDSFWMPHATELLEGDYSPLHGEQGKVRSARTRENATVLDDTSAEGPAGEDGAFTLDELADATLANRGFTARMLLEAVVARCEPVPSVEVTALAGEDGAPGLPAATVDVADACAVLGEWDGVYDLDRVGPPVWREVMSRFGFGALSDAGELWAEPFDPARPLDTPSGLAEPPAGAPDPILEALARAVQSLGAAGIPVEAPLGEVQVALRDGETIPIHGGNGRDGTTNVVTTSGRPSSMDPDIPEITAGTFATGSALGEVGDRAGYGIDYGTSFLLALAFTDDGPQARAFLTYGNTDDRSSDVFTEVTQSFSDKAWREVPFATDDVEQAAASVVTVRG
ncbi:MAG: penicillin acylase family protein [Acidimicrobiales bacterium]